MQTIYHPECDQLVHDSRLSCLTMQSFSFQLEQQCIEISATLNRYPEVPGVLLFEQSRFHSMISRQRFIETMNQPYSKELFSHRKIKKLARQFSAAALVFSADTYIGKAVEICLNRSLEQLAEPLVVIKDEIYYVLDVHQLLIAHAQIFSATVKQLREEINHSNLLREQLEVANKAAEELARRDGLTGIPNRRRMDEYLTSEWQRAVRDKTPLSIILIDIDHFKNFNDTYGHQAGDEALIRVAGCLKGQTHRPADMVARYGGEEFLIVLPDTPLDGAYSLAEKMRRAVADLHIENRGAATAGVLSISCGLSCIDSSGDNILDRLIQAADQALYEAKQGGRNRVYITPPGSAAAAALVAAHRPDHHPGRTGQTV